MKIAITRADGGVSIMTLISAGDVEGALNGWKIQHPNEYVSHKEIGIVPSDRDFRDAWTVGADPLVEINMSKAREIHLSRIRAKRDAELMQLDIESIKAQDQSDNKALEKIRAKKQQLRDLPQTIAPQINAASSPEELKNIQPL